jgi:hypothetical protein
MAALLYVWPLLFIAHILTGGFRATVFWSVLGGVAAALWIANWVITALERRYWEKHRHTLPEFADPPPWNAL